jgi:hypothetical protein
MSGKLNVDRNQPSCSLGLRQEPQAKLPEPDVYEQEYVYWPWGLLLGEAADVVAARAPTGALIVDYMCGTGFLLSRVLSKRPDLSALGCDITESYVEYGQEMYPEVELVAGDARVYEPVQRPGLVVCTAGLHHLARADQPAFVEKVHRQLPSKGYFIIGEELIGAYEDEAGRRGAIVQMFAALMGFIKQSDAPEQVVEAAADMLVNDWCERGEYKSSKAEIEKMLKPYFRVVSARRVWPKRSSGFGDWLFVCQKMQ